MEVVGVGEDYFCLHFVQVAWGYSFYAGGGAYGHEDWCGHFAVNGFK